MLQKKQAQHVASHHETKQEEGDSTHVVICTLLADAVLLV